MEARLTVGVCNIPLFFIVVKRAVSRLVFLMGINCITIGIHQKCPLDSTSLDFTTSGFTSPGLTSPDFTSPDFTSPDFTSGTVRHLIEHQTQKTLSRL